MELINKAWHYATAVKVGNFEWITMQAWQQESPTKPVLLKTDNNTLVE